ncbi:GNAT family N-acetyltransferase [Micrococcus luteus]|uniref:GNAT family N-acetyltransferase n=1 Tax=Micrococcus luteus TaxID=1270 RepID=UPI00369BF3D1
MTEQVRLRPLSPGDAPEMTRVLADPALYQYTGGEPPTVEGLTRQYALQSRGHSADETETWLNHVVVFETSGEALGYVQATIPVSGQPAEIAWVIGAPWQRQGYASAAAALLLAELADMGVKQVIAHIHPDHEASAAVARRIGMSPTGEVVDGEVRWEGPVTPRG